MSSGKVMTVQPGEIIISTEPSPNEIASGSDSDQSSRSSSHSKDISELVLDLDRLDSNASHSSRIVPVARSGMTITPNHRRCGVGILLAVTVVVTIFIRNGRFGTDKGWELFRGTIIGIIWTGWVLMLCISSWMNLMDGPVQTPSKTPSENLEVVASSSGLSI